MDALFVICISCHTVLSVLCILVVTFWERTDLFALLFLCFLCVCHFPILRPWSGIRLYGFLIFTFFISSLQFCCIIIEKQSIEITMMKQRKMFVTDNECFVCGSLILVYCILFSCRSEFPLFLPF